MLNFKIIALFRCNVVLWIPWRWKVALPSAERRTASDPLWHPLQPCRVWNACDADRYRYASASAHAHTLSPAQRYEVWIYVLWEGLSAYLWTICQAMRTTGSIRRSTVCNRPRLDVRRVRVIALVKRAQCKLLLLRRKRRPKECSPTRKSPMGTNSQKSAFRDFT